MARLRRGGKKAMKPGILGYKAFDEFGPDLIASGVDQRSERDSNFAAASAEPFHRHERRLDHAVERALPAGVGGADHTFRRVDEEQHAAIGAGHAEREAARSRRQ